MISPVIVPVVMLVAFALVAWGITPRRRWVWGSLLSVAAVVLVVGTWWTNVEIGSDDGGPIGSGGPSSTAPTPLLVP